MIFDPCINAFVTDDKKFLTCPKCYHDVKIGYHTCQCGQVYNVERVQTETVKYILTLED